MDNLLHLQQPVRCNITGPPECGKSYVLMNSTLKLSTNSKETYIFSPILHQDLNQKIIKCFSNYIPVNIIPNYLNEADLDPINDEILIDKEFEKPEKKIEACESKEDLKCQQNKVSD